MEKPGFLFKKYVFVTGEGVGAMAHCRDQRATCRLFTPSTRSVPGTKLSSRLGGRGTYLLSHLASSSPCS